MVISQLHYEFTQFRCQQSSVSFLTLPVLLICEPTIAGKESSGLKSTTLPDTKGSKKRQGRMVSARKRFVPALGLR